MTEPETRKSRSSIKSHSTIHRQSVTNMDSKSMSRVKLRKPSFGFSGVPGIRPVERTSQLGIEFKRPPTMFLNTYQLDPHPKFHLAKAQLVIDELLNEHFTGHKYNVQESTGLSIRLANELMRKIKSMSFNRYRIITIVTIGQKRAQSYNNALAFIWDHERDAYVNTQREVTSAFIQVTVYEDNSRAVVLAKYSIFTKNSKYIEEHYHYVHEWFKKGVIDVVKVNSEDNIADILTKVFRKCKVFKYETPVEFIIVSF